MVPHTKDWLREQIIDAISYAHANRVDRPEQAVGSGPARLLVCEFPDTLQLLTGVCAIRYSYYLRFPFTLIAERQIRNGTIPSGPNGSDVGP